MHDVPDRYFVTCDQRGKRIKKTWCLIKVTGYLYESDLLFYNLRASAESLSPEVVCGILLENFEYNHIRKRASDTIHGQS